GVNAGVPATVAATSANPFLGLRALQFLPPYLNIPNAVEDGRTSDSDFAYTLRLSYKASDNINVYATHATGFKASSFNLSADARPFASQFIPGSTAQSPPPAASPIRTALGAALPVNLTTGSRFANPEYATVYELGVKGQWEGFAVNVAAFIQVINGFQSNIFSGTGFILANADKQSSRGLEVDATVSPIKDLRFTANFTYLDNKFDRFPGGAALVDGSFSTVPVDLSGQRNAGVPEFSTSLATDYTVRLAGDNKLMFHIDYQHNSPTQIAQGTVALEREVNLVNTSATLVLNNKFEVTAWARNLTDEAWITTIFPGVAQAGTLSGYRNQPRTFGGLVRHRF
ncbi:MAG: TonB-dependent receptor domain-containing protein, partial [Sandarakinorhabdus sp.]